MEIYRTYSYRLTKSDSGESVFDRTLKALRDIGDAGRFDLRFFLEDSVVGSVSGCERAEKKFPALAAFKFATKGFNERPHPAISNLPIGHALNRGMTCHSNPNGQISTTAVSPDEALELIRGIPRSFPVQFAEFALDEIPVLDGQPGRVPELEVPAPLEPYSPRPCPGIVMASNWGINRREVSLSVTTALQVANDGGTLVPFSSQAGRFLEVLGVVKTTMLTLYPSLAEAEHAADLRDEIGRRYDRSERPFYVGRVNWPHVLPPEPQPLEHPLTAVAAKKPITAAFKPRGYRRLTKESGLGRHMMVKTSPAGNIVELSFDTGTWSRGVGAIWRFRGPLVSCVVSVQPDDQHDQPQYLVGSDEALQMVVDNWAAVADFLEQTAMPELDRLFGPAPAWFTADG